MKNKRTSYTINEILAHVESRPLVLDSLMMLFIDAEPSTYQRATKYYIDSLIKSKSDKDFICTVSFIMRKALLIRNNFK